MKFSDVAILSLLSFGTGGAARSSRFRVQDDDNNNSPLPQRSRVTAFLITDEGPKVQCWEIGEFLPETSNAKRSARGLRLFGEKKPDVSLFSWPPGTTLIEFNPSGLKTSAFDLAAKPSLFTIKDGIVLITTTGEIQDGVQASADNTNSYVFADLNGDDWFYFEDTPSSSSAEDCDKSRAKRKASEGGITATTASGSDTTVIKFEHNTRPTHKVLHDGACHFAGLAPSQIQSRD